MPAVRPLAASVLALGLGSCVVDTTVIGDDLSRLACAEASPLVAPPMGCTSIVVESRGPYGCVLDDGFGTPLAGSWIRLLRDASQEVMLRVTLLRGPGVCVEGDARGADAGPSDCAASVRLTGQSDAPCTCRTTSLAERRLVERDPWMTPMTGTEQQLLVSLGSTVEVSLCSASRGGP